MLVEVMEFGQAGELKPLPKPPWSLLLEIQCLTALLHFLPAQPH